MCMFVNELFYLFVLWMIMCMRRISFQSLVRVHVYANTEGVRLFTTLLVFCCWIAQFFFLSHSLFALLRINLCVLMYDYLYVNVFNYELHPCACVIVVVLLLLNNYCLIFLSPSFSSLRVYQRLCVCTCACWWLTARRCRNWIPLWSSRCVWILLRFVSSILACEVRARTWR